MPKLLAAVHVEVFVHGNLTSEEASSIGNVARGTLLSNAEPVHANLRPFSRIVQFAKSDDKCVLAAYNLNLSLYFTIKYSRSDPLPDTSKASYGNIRFSQMLTWLCSQWSPNTVNWPALIHG